MRAVRLVGLIRTYAVSQENLTIYLFNKTEIGKEKIDILALRQRFYSPSWCPNWSLRWQKKGKGILQNRRTSGGPSITVKGVKLKGKEWCKILCFGRGSLARPIKCLVKVCPV